MVLIFTPFPAHRHRLRFDRAVRTISRGKFDSVFMPKMTGEELLDYTLDFNILQPFSSCYFARFVVSAVPAWFRVNFRLVQENPPILRSRCFAAPFPCVAGSQFISLQNKHMIHIFIIEERPAGDMFLVSWVILPRLRG